MAPASLEFSPRQRTTLLEYERLHARWQQAVEAARAWEGGVPADEVAAQRMLQQSLEADEACQAAMRFLREDPI